jgi:hypothetical protein
MGIATGKILLSGEVLRALLDKAHSIYSAKNENAILLIDFIRQQNFPKDYPTSGEGIVV